MESRANVQRDETNRRFKVKSDPGEILGASVQIKQTLCQRSSLGEPSIIRRGDYYRDVFNIQFQRCKVKGEGFFFLSGCYYRVMCSQRWRMSIKRKSR